MVNSVSKDIAIKFCEECNWAYESWVTHKTLFDKNKTPESNIGKSAYFTNRLSIITQEYSLQQIAKLHDPAIQGSSRNLTIDYIVQFGDWAEDAQEIERIKCKLHDFWIRIKAARNKALAHNDLESMMSNVTHGVFESGMDDEYFSTLQLLANKVHTKWVDGIFPFNDLAISDAREFLALLEQAK